MSHALHMPASCCGGTERVCGVSLERVGIKRLRDTQTLPERAWALSAQGMLLAACVRGGRCLSAWGLPPERMEFFARVQKHRRVGGAA